MPCRKPWSSNLRRPSLSETHSLPGKKRVPFELFDPKDYLTVFLMTEGSYPRVVPIDVRAAALPIELLFCNEQDRAYGPSTLAIPLNPVKKLVFERLGIGRELSQR